MRLAAARVAAFVAAFVAIPGGLPPSAVAQPTADVPAQIAAIDRIAWLVGEWEGGADWQRGQERSSVISWERVTRASGGTALVVFGRHFERLPDGARGKPVHDASGLITFDTRTGRYRVTSQTAAGQYGSFDGEAEGGAQGATFTWRIVTPQGVVRNRIELDAERRWRERSAFCVGGEKPDTPCREFLDMTLVRKGD